MEFVVSGFDFALPVGPFFRYVKNGVLHVHDHFIPTHRDDYKPHVLSPRALALFSALLLSVKIFVIAAVAFGPAAVAESSAITTGNIIQLTNQSRIDLGLLPLSENAALAAAAQAKAEDMLS